MTKSAHNNQHLIGAFKLFKKPVHSLLRSIKNHNHLLDNTVAHNAVYKLKLFK